MPFRHPGMDGFLEGLEIRGHRFGLLTFQMGRAVLVGRLFTVVAEAFIYLLSKFVEPSSQLCG